MTKILLHLDQWEPVGAAIIAFGKTKADLGFSLD